VQSAGDLDDSVTDGRVTLTSLSSTFPPYTDTVYMGHYDSISMS